jgi:hypothetical protein
LTGRRNRNRGITLPEILDAPLKRVSLLSAASTGKSSNSTLSPAAEAMPGAKWQAPSLRDYFEHLKGWVGTAYYSSEPGMKELGWDGENFFESLPGCEHADGHA